ncbi:MAG TPA: LamG-like jellyroll fold domain-containing protein, partial [Patescibacteria group bacterium]|nr:LamG-like jellyroll fold domain-containing protein [Patescibacteria group bacterium]
EFSIWVNGTKGDNTGSISNLNDSTADPLLIGARGSVTSPNSLFNGQIDDVRVYNYALTEEQVRSVYNNGSAQLGTGD